MSKWRKQRNRRKNRRPEKLFVVRDNYGHSVEISGTGLSENEIKIAFKLSPDYDLGDCEVYGSWGWESKDEWCNCGDPDCLIRRRNGEICCSDEPPA
jgi:hypothetical protein